ncbi:glycoside hydrolase family 64 protein [Streptomyces varsoviensis]|uniref:glycoside hydrolase family 64 protein n=1 Tax=Streptomyces varsoviensis TaxID=67373 RepID=UPI0033ED84C3
MSTHISRRKLLGGVAATVAAAGTGLTLASPRAIGAQRQADTLPLTIVNRTGKFGNSSIWVYIVGNQGDRQVRVTRDGKAVPVQLSDNGAGGWTDYAIPLAGNGDTKLSVPRMSGRIYVSLGSKLKLKVVKDGAGRPALQYPAGWVSGDPNYKILHDSAEFTFDAGGMGWNTTMVDMFSVPLALRLTGSRTQTAGTLKPGARAKIFSDVAAVPAFKPLVLGGDLRVIAPGHGLDAGLFAKDYLAPYVDQVWNAYTSKDLKVTTNAGKFTGRVRGGKLTFTGPAAVSIAKPSTRDVLFCHGALAAPNDGLSGPVAAVLGAALNRTTLHNTPNQPTTDPAAFYRERLTNHYAKAMHAASTDGRAYGFAFDDVAGFAPYIHDPAPTGMTLTLTPF